MRLLRKKVLLTVEEEKCNVIKSRRLITYQALPAHSLPSMASQAHTDKSRGNALSNPVTEHAWDGDDPHHIHGSNLIKTSE